MNFKRVSLIIFPWTLSNLNWEKREGCILMIFCNKWCLLYLKYLPAIDSSFVTNTKPISKKTGETFCEGLKWMCKPFEINGQNFFEKLFIFSKFTEHFVKEYSQRNSHSFSESGIPGFSPMSYNENNLPVKLSKSLCQDIWICKS